MVGSLLVLHLLSLHLLFFLFYHYTASPLPCCPLLRARKERLPSSVSLEVYLLMHHIVYMTPEEGFFPIQ